MRNVVTIAAACWLLLVAIVFAGIGLYWLSFITWILAYLLLDYWERAE